MAPAAMGNKWTRDPQVGDLVLAKVKGYPPWPAKVNKPEDWNMMSVPHKFFVLFFGTKEIAFVALQDLEPFTEEVKNDWVNQARENRLPKKYAKYLEEALVEICKAYDDLLNSSETENGLLPDRTLDLIEKPVEHPIKPPDDGTTQNLEQMEGDSFMDNLNTLGHISVTEGGVKDGGNDGKHPSATGSKRKISVEKDSDHPKKKKNVASKSATDLHFEQEQLPTSPCSERETEDQKVGKESHPRHLGHRCPMASAAKSKKWTRDPQLGDLVLAKVKGYPRWPAKVSRPEDWNQVPVPDKFFVLFFTTKEIAFVALRDLEPFTEEVKNDWVNQARENRLPKKYAKYLEEALVEICKAYDDLLNSSETENGLLPDRTLELIEKPVEHPLKPPDVGTPQNLEQMEGDSFMNNLNTLGHISVTEGGVKDGGNDGKDPSATASKRKISVEKDSDHPKKKKNVASKSATDLHFELEQLPTSPCSERETEDQKVGKESHPRRLGHRCPMASDAKSKKWTRDPQFGDLVLAKVKGYPPWPAKVSRPKDWNQVPVPDKFFVLFFTTKEIAFVALRDLEPFTEEVKNDWVNQARENRLPKKYAKYLEEALVEICKAYDDLLNSSETENGLLPDRTLDLIEKPVEHPIKPPDDGTPQNLEQMEGDSFMDNLNTLGHISVTEGGVKDGGNDGKDPSATASKRKIFVEKDSDHPKKKKNIASKSVTDLHLEQEQSPTSPFSERDTEDQQVGKESHRTEDSVKSMHLIAAAQARRFPASGQENFDGSSADNAAFVSTKKKAPLSVRKLANKNFKLRLSLDNLMVDNCELPPSLRVSTKKNAELASVVELLDTKNRELRVSTKKNAELAAKVELLDTKNRELTEKIANKILKLGVSLDNLMADNCELRSSLRASTKKNAELAAKVELLDTKNRELTEKIEVLEHGGVKALDDLEGAALALCSLGDCMREGVGEETGGMTTGGNREH